MSLAAQAPRFRAIVILALFAMVTAPAALIIYQSFLSAPFFDETARPSLEAYAFILTDPEFYRLSGRRPSTPSAWSSSPCR